MKHRWWVALALAVAAFATLPAHAADESAFAMHAVRLLPGETIRLDGTLQHPAWQRAPVHERFEEKFPDTGAPPARRTQVQVLFDERAIYVGVTAFDERPHELRDQRVRHDGVNRTQDFVVVYLDAIGQRSSAQFFRVNVAGSTADGLHTASDDSEDFAPDFDWDAATARLPAEGAQGWTAVFRLPFASLRFAEGTQTWRIMVGRRLPREQFHLMTSVPIPRDAASFIATLQPLLGVELPRQHHFLTLRPGFTARVTDRNTPPTAAARDTQAEASLDLKWRPRAELVVDGTLNPDFSQVALDVPQLAGNSRFALFLTEKRPFFFESADLLRSPTDALYTRSFTQPRAGLRATWRDSAWAGTAFAIRDRGQGLVLLPGAYGTGFAEQPGSNSLTMRARHDQGTLAWGGIASARRYDRNGGDNAVLGPDAAWQISDQWRLRAQWLHARTTAQPDADGVLAAGTTTEGERVLLRLVRNTGEGETALLLDDIGRGFRHDSGFVNQAGVRLMQGFHSLGWRNLGPFNEFFVNVEARQVRDKAGGQVVSEYIRPGLWSSAARNLEWWFEFFVHSRLRTAAQAPLLAERYVATGLVMTPATWLPLIEASTEFGRLADTAAGAVGAGGPEGEVRRGARVNLSAKARPLAALELEPSLRLAWLDRNGASGTRERAYRETAQQWLAVWHFDARHTLRAIFQRSTLERLAEPGGAAFDALRRTESLTYAWRHSAGTRVYVGATRTREGRGSVAQTREGFIKLELDADDLLRAWRG